MQQQHGSGKTAVLVERIINKILNENIDIDKLLVVTFTNAAASEMRERVLNAIYKKIDDEPDNDNLQRQITLLSKSNICTIDSFCLDVVRNNFFELDISPNFRIGDSTEIEILKQEVIEDMFEEKYENQDKDFTKLLNTYTSYKDDTPLKELILKIFTYTQSNPFPQKWIEEKVEMFNLKEQLDEDFAKTIWGKILLEEINETLMDCIIQLQEAKKELAKYTELLAYEQVIADDIEQLQNLKQNLHSWNSSYVIAKELKFKTWPKNSKITISIKDKVKAIRDSVKDTIKKKIDKILIFSSEEANQDIYDMYEVLAKLKNSILEFGEKYAKRKKEKNIVDFSDVEHFALQILLKEENGTLKQTEIAKKYQEKFEEIAIDEYQDSNLVQEYILTSISRGNNIFMVGDVKQSIYKFRQAMPELFLDKYSKYKLKENKRQNDNLKIQLFKNFRSRKGILDFTNIIFQNIMSSQLGDIEYNEDEYLNLGANYKENCQNLKAEINIINIQENTQNDTYEEDEEENEVEREKIEDIELEAKFVANRIYQLIESNFQVYDVKKEEFRPITYKDIVILLRSTKESAPIFEKEMLSLGMPVFSDTSSEYLGSIEIQTILSLLKIIDNPMQEIPLVAVMRSSIGGFTDNELVEIRLVDKYDNFYNTLLKAKIDADKPLREKIKKFLDNLETWRKEQEYLSLDELIWKIYTDTGYYDYVGLMTNGALRQANLKILFERAKNCESISFKGLFNFINYIEKVKTSSKDMDSAKIIGENDNVIRIMSIHKSKGLEFPVVFLSGTGKSFNLQDLNNKILLHQDMGIGVKFIDYDRQIEYDTLSKQAMRNKLYIETLSEEMRILYVALTRAKEKLIITGYSKNDEKQLETMKNMVDKYLKNDKINPILIKKYKSYLDWIRLVYLYNQEVMKDLAEMNSYSKDQVLKLWETTEQTLSSTENAIKEETEPKETTQKYIYRFEKSTQLPTKASVTALKELANKKTSLYETLEVPILNFLNEDSDIIITPTQKGTLIHLCLQKLDISKKNYTFKEIDDFTNMLVAKKIITQKEKEAININKILQFTKSKIWQELGLAKEVCKEKPFYINIPAKEIYNDESLTEDILVQGIIDLYYIDKDNNLVLVDYKTDYVENRNEQILIDKYKTQLALYKRALESALGRKVDKIYIYSTYLEKEIDFYHKI